MHDRGLVKSGVAKSVPFEDVPELKSTANNSRTVANRGFALGWKPSRASLFDTLDNEVVWTTEAA
jgi:hypothetical protein